MKIISDFSMFNNLHLFALVTLLSGCTYFSGSTTVRELTHYWSQEITPNEIQIQLSLSDTLDSFGPWNFPDFQGFPNQLIGDDYRHAMMASPYIDSQMRHTLLTSEDRMYQGNYDSVVSKYSLSAEKTLSVEFSTAYGSHIIGGGGGGLTIYGIPDTKKSILSYPLILPTEIVYFSGKLDASIQDFKWSPERLNRIMQKNGTIWSATGFVKDWKNTGSSSFIEKSIVRTWFSESEIQYLDTIRLRIFPEGYNENIVLPIVRVVYEGLLESNETLGDMDIFFEKDGKITQKVLPNKTISGEIESKSIQINEKIIILTNLSHKEIDTLVIKKGAK